MPTKQELAEEAKVAQLKQLAADKEVDLGGATKKDDIVAAITSSGKVTKSDLEAALNGDDAAHAASQDPAIIDPEKMAAERAEGRTSDPSFRDAGTSVNDPAPDLTLGPKETDGGPERYPFPQAGDVEVALVDPGDGTDEFGPVLHEGHWVKLGSDEMVPERHRGSLAVVLSSPWVGTAPGGENTEVVGYAYHPDRNDWRVRVRDETDAILSFPGDTDPDVLFASTGSMRGDVASHA